MNSPWLLREILSRRACPAARRSARVGSAAILRAFLGAVTAPRECFLIVVFFIFLPWAQRHLARRPLCGQDGWGSSYPSMMTRSALDATCLSFNASWYSGDLQQSRAA